MNIQDCKNYRALIIINEILINNREFRVVLNNEDEILEPLLKELLHQDYLDIDNGRYVVTKKGEDVFNVFEKRYHEYLKVYDIYSLVDTEAGEFAFEYYYDFDSDEKWDEFKNAEHFFDLRIAIANFKGMNPHEIVFMSFLNENRFDTETEGWQYRLLSNEIWEEIDEICETSITVEDLGDEDTIINIIKKGTDVMMFLFNKEIEINKERLEQVSALEQEDEEYVVITETITEYEDYIDYYDPYYNPYYYSPIWVTPLFIWI